MPFLQHQVPSNRGYVSYQSIRISYHVRVLLVVTFLLMNEKSVTAFLVPDRAGCSPRHEHHRGQHAFSQKLNENHRYLYNDSFVRKKLTRLQATVPENDSPASIDRNLGILVLSTVPLAWGTFEPAVRYVYKIEPAVPGFVFSVGYYLVAALSLSALLGLSMLRNGNDSDEKKRNEKATSLPIRGGIELGIYLFLGNGLQVLGLKTVPSDRAAFLLQLTTIFVPLVQAAFARDLFAISVRTWGACLLALTGVAVMGMDGQGDVQAGSAISTFMSSFSSLTTGDFLIMLAAFAYTFHCIRLGHYAKETSALKLAACKATAETTLCLALVLGLVAYGGSAVDSGGILSYAAEEGNEISNFVTSMSEGISSGSVSQAMLLPALGAVLWTGWVSIAYTIYAQSFGQSRVNPTDANLIYTIQPIFTAIFAWVLLGETLGPAGYIGGALIGTAVYLVAVSEEGGGETDDDEYDSVSEGILE